MEHMRPMGTQTGQHSKPALPRYQTSYKPSVRYQQSAKASNQKSTSANQPGTLSKRRIRHRPRRRLARKRRRPNHCCLGPHALENVLHDPLLLGLHLHTGIVVAGCSAASAADGG